MRHRIYWMILLTILTALLLAACGTGGTAQPTLVATTASTTEATAAATTAATVAATDTPVPMATTTTEATTEPTAGSPTIEPTTMATMVSTTSAPTSTVVLTGTQIDMNNPIFKAYFATYNKFPRRMQSEVVDAKTQKTTNILIETDSKDHLHLDVNGMGNTGDITTSLIIISPTMYLKQGTQWQQLPGTQAGAMLGMLTSADSLQQVLNAFNELTSYSVSPIGPEDVNGVPAMAYSSEFTMKDGTTSQGKAWVSSDGLIVKDMIVASNNITITTMFDYDPTIKVEAPTP